MIKKEIKGLPGYFVTEDGLIFSKTRQLKPQISGQKLHRVYNFRFSTKKGIVAKNIHKLVAEAYIPNPDNLPFVSHKNGNSLDNRVSNLYWATKSPLFNKSLAEGLNLKQIEKIRLEVLNLIGKMAKKYKTSSEIILNILNQNNY